MKKILMVVFSLILLSTFTLANTSNINVPAGDENSYKGTLDYSQSTVSFVYDAVQHLRLSGLITASGMKHNFTYQVKLLGKPTCKYGSSGNDTLNEYIGYHGRWTCASCDDSSVDKNRNDAQYAANKAKSDSDPTKECIQSYLVFDFFTTNASGYSQKNILSDSSYHVLFCNGGSCGSTSNAYLVNGLCSANNVEGQIERGSCGSLTLKPGKYNLSLVLTEESFHLGAWASVLQGDVNFQITDENNNPPENPPSCNNLLHEIDIGDQSSESGHSLVGWSYIGDNYHDGNGYLRHGTYGGYDSDGNLRGIMGPPGNCDSSDVSATFTFDAGQNLVSSIVIRNLDGSEKDSFDVCIVENNIDNCFGHYEFDGNPAEEWKTSSFSLPSPKSGLITFKLIATDPAGSWCSAGWGQVAINWIKFYGCEQQIPEFGTIAAMLALCGATLVFFAVRKK